MTDSILFFGDLSSKWTRSSARLDALKTALPDVQIDTRNWNPTSWPGRFMLKAYFKSQLPLLAPIYLLMTKKIDPKSLIWVDNFPLFPNLFLRVFKFYLPEVKIIFISEDNFLLKHNHARLHRPILPFYDQIFTTKRYVCENTGGQFTVQKIFDSFDERLITEDHEYQTGYKFDVCFIGSFEIARFNHLCYLSKNGIQISIFGNGWPKKTPANMTVYGPVYGPEFRKTVHRSRINLIFLRHQNFDEVTSRSYEIPAFNVFFLAEKSSVHKQLYGVSGILFTSRETLLERVNYWLKKSDEERNKLSQKISNKISVPRNTIRHQVLSILAQTNLEK